MKAEMVFLWCGHLARPLALAGETPAPQEKDVNLISLWGIQEFTSIQPMKNQGFTLV